MDDTVMTYEQEVKTALSIYHYAKKSITFADFLAHANFCMESRKYDFRDDFMHATLLKIANDTELDLLIDYIQKSWKHGNLFVDQESPGISKREVHGAIPRIWSPEKRHDFIRRSGCFSEIEAKEQLCEIINQGTLTEAIYAGLVNIVQEALK